MGITAMELAHSSAEEPAIVSGEGTAIRFPISNVLLGYQEHANVARCISSGWISSRGEFVNEFERMNAAYHEGRLAVAAASGTAALHLALLALGIGPGDAVIVPDMTFAATINAVLHCGARPVIAPVSNVDWNIDCASLPGLVTPETKAIIAVHLYGRPCNMDELLAVAKRFGLALIEDCAQAHGARYGTQPVGTFGDVACFSFFGNKIVTTGEGGLCLTADPHLQTRMRLFRDHGKASDIQYWHSEVGYNYRLTNLQAAVGCAQMARIEEFLSARDRIHRRYLLRFSEESRISIRPPLHNGREVCWRETILVDAPSAGVLVEQLRCRGIDARPTFTPLSRMPIYAGYAHRHDTCADMVWRRGLSLPTYVGLRDADIDEICENLFASIDGLDRSQ